MTKVLRFKKRLIVMLMMAIFATNGIYGKPDGAPLSTCLTLLPIHGTYKAKTEISPYAILVSQITYKPGENITVMLRGLCQMTLKGFIVQVRRIDPRDPRSKQEPIGRFDIIPGSRYECGDNHTTLTHSSPLNETSIRMNWTAPTSPQGHLQVFATIVQKFDTFWAKLTSAVIQDVTAQPMSVNMNDLRTPFIQPCDSDRSTTAATVALTTSTVAMTTTASHPDSNSTSNVSSWTTYPNTTAVLDTSLSQWTTLSVFPSTTIMLTTVTTTVLMPPDWSKAASIEDIAESPKCGQDRGCFLGCNGRSCDFTVMWSDMGEFYWFDVKARRLSSDGQYVALAFSTDQNMGSDSVIECVDDSDESAVHMSYNTRYGNTPMTHLDNVLLKLAHIEVKGDDLLRCQFARKKIVEENKAHDLSKIWYLMIAQGTIVGGVKQEHSRTPSVSVQAVDLSMLQVVWPKVIQDTFIKIHACLMIFAWLFCASIGTVMARFYKPLWPNTKICGRKIWYTVHRICMLIACFLTIAGFVLIFYEVQGLSEISTLRLKKLHPVVGIATTCLIVLQVLMGIFRPSSASVNRPVFNYGHWLLGIITHVATVFNIVIGCGLQRAAVHFVVVYLVYGFSAYQVLMVIVLEIIFCNIRVHVKKQQTYSIYEMRNTIYSSTKDLLEETTSEPPKSSLLKFLLGVHILLIASITTVVIAMILLMPVKLN